VSVRRRNGLPPRVLLIGPQLVLGWTESTARALEKLGCLVSTIYYNQSPWRERIGGARRSIAAALGLSSLSTSRWFQQRYAAWLARCAGRRMVQAARTFRPDLVLVLKGESLQPALLRTLKQTTRATLAVWWVDHPFMNAETRQAWDYVPGCVPLFDHCFVFDRTYEASLREAGAREVTFLPCAADEALYRPLQLTAAERESFGVDVSMVGVYTESRAKIMEAFVGMPGVGIWGPGWERFLADRATRDHPLLRGQGLPPQDACKVYNSSLVNLNTHHHQSRDGGVNTRAFEILAAGGFELTDEVPGMAELIEPGRHVATYRNAEEAAELTRYYGKAERERRRIAEAGLRQVLERHTYAHRMRTLLERVA
jgi:spore maturation protein CgeB